MSSYRSWDSGLCSGRPSDSWTCCGSGSACPRHGRWDRDGSDLGSRSPLALLALAFFACEAHPFLTLLCRGVRRRLPLSLLRVPIGIRRGFLPRSVDALLALAHRILLSLVAFDVALRLILHVGPPHHEEEAELSGQHQDEGSGEQAFDGGRHRGARQGPFPA